jgi:hypothetical protein
MLNFVLGPYFSTFATCQSGICTCNPDKLFFNSGACYFYQKGGQFCKENFLSKLNIQLLIILSRFKKC